MKTLDLADKYPPSEDFEDDDDRPTIKVQVFEPFPQVIVGDEQSVDLYGERDTIPSPPSYPECEPERMETTYPGVGLIIALGFGVAFWATVSYFLFVR